MLARFVIIKIIILCKFCFYFMIILRHKNISNRASRVEGESLITRSNALKGENRLHESQYD